jgi:hypothetical protein
VVHTDCHPVDSAGHSLRERCRRTVYEPQLLGAGQTDTLLRALTKRAYGFDRREALIAVALLTRGGTA